MKVYIKQLIETYEKAIEEYKKSKLYATLVMFHVDEGVCNCAAHTLDMDYNEQDEFWSKVIEPYIEDQVGYWCRIPYNFPNCFNHNIKVLEFRLELLKIIYERIH